MSRTSKRNAWIAGVVALVVLLGLGAWTVASRSTSTDDLAGASSTGNFGSVVTVRNDGGYILQVTNQRTGGVWRLPSCTQDTQWPGNPNIAWDPVTNPAVVVPANPTSCEQSWREVTAGQTIDNKLLIEACIGGTVASAGGAEGCKSGKSSPAFGLRELPIETSSSGGVCGQLSCSAPHYISSGARVILNRVGVIGETWKFNPVGDEGLQANAENVGARLANRWAELSTRHPIIGAVHGMGLYMGVELVRDRVTLEPAIEETTAICERLLAVGVIMQPTSERQNVLKIKPPMCLSLASADFFVDALDEVLTAGW